MAFSDETRPTFEAETTLLRRAWDVQRAQLDVVVTRLGKINTVDEKHVNTFLGRMLSVHVAWERLKDILQALGDALGEADALQLRYHDKQAAATLESARWFEQVLAQAEPRLPIDSLEADRVKQRIYAVSRAYGAMPWQAGIAAKWLGSQGFGTMQDVVAAGGPLEEVMKAGLAMGVTGRGESMEPLARAHGKFLHATGRPVTAGELRKTLVAHQRLFKGTPVEAQDIEELSNVAAVLSHEAHWTPTEILSVYSRLVEVMGPEQSATALKRIVGVMSKAGAAADDSKFNTHLKNLGLDPAEDHIAKLRPAEFFATLGEAISNPRLPVEDRNWLMQKIFEERAKTPALVLGKIAEDLPATIRGAEDFEAYEGDVANALSQDFAASNRARGEAEEMLETPAGNIDEQIKRLLPLRVIQMGGTPKMGEIATERYSKWRENDISPAEALRLTGMGMRPADEFLESILKLDAKSLTKDIVADTKSVLFDRDVHHKAAESVRRDLGRVIQRYDAGRERKAAGEASPPPAMATDPPLEAPDVEAMPPPVVSPDKGGGNPPEASSAPRRLQEQAPTPSPPPAPAATAKSAPPPPAAARPKAPALSPAQAKYLNRLMPNEARALRTHPALARLDAPGDDDRAAAVEELDAAAEAFREKAKDWAPTRYRNPVGGDLRELPDELVEAINKAETKPEAEKGIAAYEDHYPERKRGLAEFERALEKAESPAAIEELLERAPASQLRDLAPRLHELRERTHDEPGKIRPELEELRRSFPPLFKRLNDQSYYVPPPIEAGELQSLLLDIRDRFAQRRVWVDTRVAVLRGVKRAIVDESTPATDRTPPLLARTPAMLGATPVTFLQAPPTPVAGGEAATAIAAAPPTRPIWGPWHDEAAVKGVRKAIADELARLAKVREASGGAFEVDPWPWYVLAREGVESVPIAKAIWGRSLLVPVNVRRWFDEAVVQEILAEHEKQMKRTRAPRGGDATLRNAAETIFDLIDGIAPYGDEPKENLIERARRAAGLKPIFRDDLENAHLRPHAKGTQKDDDDDDDGPVPVQPKKAAGGAAPKMTQGDDDQEDAKDEDEIKENEKRLAAEQRIADRRRAAASARYKELPGGGRYMKIEGRPIAMDRDLRHPISTSDRQKLAKAMVEDWQRNLIAQGHAGVGGPRGTNPTGRTAREFDEMFEAAAKRTFGDDWVEEHLFPNDPGTDMELEMKSRGEHLGRLTVDAFVPDAMREALRPLMEKAQRSNDPRDREFERLDAAISSTAADLRYWAGEVPGRDKTSAEVRLDRGIERGTEELRRWARQIEAGPERIDDPAIADPLDNRMVERAKQADSLIAPVRYGLADPVTGKMTEETVAPGRAPGRGEIAEPDDAEMALARSLRHRDRPIWHPRWMQQLTDAMEQKMTKRLRDIDATPEDKPISVPSNVELFEQTLKEVDPDLARSWSGPGKEAGLWTGRGLYSRVVMEAAARIAAREAIEEDRREAWAFESQADDFIGGLLWNKLVPDEAGPFRKMTLEAAKDIIRGKRPEPDRERDEPFYRQPPKVN